MTTLNHPAMRVGLLELGSVVLDVDGDVLTARFLNSLARTSDAFTIVKGKACTWTCGLSRSISSPKLGM